MTAQTSTFDEVPVEKRPEGELEAELDDEVEKELREFEQLQTGLLTGKTGAESRRRVVEKPRVEKDDASGSDMELDDLEGDKAKAKTKTTNSLTLSRLQPVLNESNPSGDFRVLPETLAEENLTNDSVLGKSRTKPSLDKEILQNLIDSAKVDPPGSPEPNDDDDNDSDFPSPGRRKSRSRARSKRSKSSRSEPRNSAQKKPRTSKSPGTVPLGQDEMQDPALHWQNSTGTKLGGSGQTAPTRDFEDPALKFPGQRISLNGNTKISEQAVSVRKDPVVLVQKSVNFKSDETPTACDALQSTLGKGQWGYEQAESEERKSSERRALEKHVRAIDFGSAQQSRVQPVWAKHNSPGTGQSLNQKSQVGPNVNHPTSPEHQKHPNSERGLTSSANPSNQKEQVNEHLSSHQSQPPSGPSSIIEKFSYCVVERVLHRKFKNSLSLDKEKLELLSISRPAIQCPELHPHVRAYENKVWLAACNELKRFFCWPCLFFASKVVWSLTCDENTTETTFGRELHKHTQSSMHSESTKQMEAFKVKHQIGMKPSVLARNVIEGTEKEQRAVLESRPKPVLDIPNDQKQSKDHEALKKFFGNFDWICPCSDTGKFYCWPCMLFSDDKWSYSGTFRAMENAALLHRSSHPHLLACFKLGKLEFDLRQKPESKEETEKMRSIIIGLAEILCAEKKKINNTDYSALDFMDTLELMSGYNDKVRISMDGKSRNSKMAAAQVLTTSIFDSIEYFIRSGIVEEIQNSNFLSLIFDHSSGFSGKAILSVVARYVDGNGRVQERFVKLLNVGYNTPFSSLTDEVFLIIAELQCRSSLVGFTYDGYLVKPGDIPNFNEKIQKFCPNAKFFHYSQHDFKRVLKQTLSHVPICRRVLQAIEELSNFFESTPGARKGLLDIVTAAEHSNCKNIWKSSNFITTVFVYHAVIVEIMQSISKRPQDFKVRTVVQAKNFLDFFGDSTNRFFVTLMARIFTTVDDLSKELEQEGRLEGLKTISSRTALKLQKLGKNFDNVVESACSHLEATMQENVRQEMLALREQSSSVVRLVVKLVKNRIFGMDAGYFKTSTTDPSSDTADYIELNDMRMYLLCVALPSTINAAKLQNELRFFHDSPICSGSCLSDIVADVVNYNMCQALPELSKFLRLALTIPKKVYSKTVISAVVRMTSYIDGKKELNSSDALFWMEKEFLSDLQKDPQFYRRVADRVVSMTDKEIVEQFIK